MDPNDVNLQDLQLRLRTRLQIKRHDMDLLNDHDECPNTEQILNIHIIFLF